MGILASHDTGRTRTLWLRRRSLANPRFGFRRIVAVVISGALTALGSCAVAANAGSRGGLHVVRLGPGETLPSGVAVAADGSPWFISGGRVIHMTADGRAVVNRLPRGTGVDGMVWGRDGALWGIDVDISGVVRVTVDGHVTRYPRLWGPGPDAQGFISGPSPEKIIPGPDGAMWFGDQEHSRIMSVRADGATRVVASLEPEALPELLVTGADGSVWYTDIGSAGGLGRVLPDGRLDVIRDPGSTFPAGAVAANGDVWFIRIVFGEDDSAKKTELVRVDTHSGITRFRTPTAEYWEITAGPDGTIWMAGDGVIRLDPEGHLQRIRRAPDWRRVDAIAAGSDGRVWLIFGRPFDTDTAAPVRAAWLPPDPCLSARQVALRLKPRRGEHIRSATVSVQGQPTRTVRGRHLSIPVDLRGYLRGTVRVTVKVRTTQRRYTRRHVYRTC
jgi:virginiamycin B lyase